MVDDVNIPNLDGYVPIKEAARLLGVSDKRVYQYVMSGRLSAQRIGHILIIPVEEVKQFKPSPSGRMRAKAPEWRVYRSGGTLLITDIHVQVRTGQQAMLIEKLKAIQEAESHTFPGTVARYITKGDPELTTVQILLIWKDTEMPDATLRQQHLKALQNELADVLVWETAQYSTNEAIIHT
jgi:excisionase family DNA binding protein